MDYYRMRSNSDLTVHAFHGSPFPDFGSHPLLNPDISPTNLSQTFPSGIVNSQPAFDLSAYLNERSPYGKPSYRPDIEITELDSACDSHTGDSSPSREGVVYYPGIELKLGKERDTIIRPLLTSIFRSSKDAFKAALLEAGLKYGELRMWKDAQLCTAIHVADAFCPGVWDRATELHVRKTSKRNSRKRMRSVTPVISGRRILVNRRSLD